MTFEKVLEVFKEYLAEDTNCEVVLTKHGYTIMQWDENSKSWYGVEHCEAPEDLQEELLSSYRMNEAEKITKTKRELTEEEAEAVNEKCKKIFALCE
ncbi:MAG: hypothetical protein RR444_08240 [Oscillospiraceae bacterium]